MPNRYSIVATKYTGLPESFMMDLKPGEPAVLVREPGNVVDRNAVAIYIRGQRVGYIPRANNTVLANFIDQQGTMAQDSALPAEKQITGVFVRSPNSGYPQVEV